MYLIILMKSSAYQQVQEHPKPNLVVNLESFTTHYWAPREKWSASAF